MVALSSVLACGSLASLLQHPTIRRFLKGATNLCPSMMHRYPTWDLSVVLNSLKGALYEPLRTTSLRLLSCKVTFWWQLPLQGEFRRLPPSLCGDLCVFHTDCMVFRLDPTFVPKINTPFHWMQELILPNFCPHPAHPLKHHWHTLDVRRALQIYLKRIADLRKMELLFVSFIPVSLGCKVTPTISRWIRQAISKAYDLHSLPRRAHLTVHSTHSAATASWAT